MNLEAFKALSMDAVREISMAIQHLEQVKESPEGIPFSIVENDYKSAWDAIGKAECILDQIRCDISAVQLNHQFTAKN